jgi:hypothetical protein
MKNRYLKIISAYLLLTFFAVNLNAQDTKLPAWAFGPFIRPASVNPIISPDTTSRFYDPMRKRQMDWESNDTFNPGATIKDGKIYILYRAVAHRVLALQKVMTVSR